MYALTKSARTLTATAAAIALFAGATCASATSVGDGIVLDQASATVYIMSPKGIEARRIADGTVRWHSADALRPLAVDDGQLLAQGATRGLGSLPLMLLDGNTGDTRHAFSATLPGNVRASVDERLGQRFAVSSADGALVWRYDSRVVQGIPPQASTPPRTRLDGMIAVDLVKGAARAMTREAPAERAIDVELSTPLVNDAGRQFYSSDQQHVLVSARLEAGDVQRRYRWTLYDLERKRLGSFDSPVSYSPFVVSEGRVLMVAPPSVVNTEQGEQHAALSVRAFALTSGKEAWRAPLRDTRFRGPFPP